MSASISPNRSASWRVLSRASRTTHYTARVGFTLVELALVVMILGLLLTLSIPRLHATAQRLRVEQAAFELAQLLRLAHEYAVADGREMVWVWEPSARRAHVESSGEAPTSAREVVLTGATIPDPIAVRLDRRDGRGECDCVRFFPEGTSESASVSIGMDSSLYIATVDEATGQVLLAQSG